MATGPPAYFTDYARQEVEQRLGVGVIDSHRGARVHTPLDLTLQRFAEATVARGLDQLEQNWPRLRRADPAERLQAALIALDPTTGEIRALVGGREYRTSQFNRAVLARRQPGSAFKPFVYLAALSARRSGPAFTLPAWEYRTLRRESDRVFRLRVGSVTRGGAIVFSGLCLPQGGRGFLNTNGER